METLVLANSFSPNAKVSDSFNLLKGYHFVKYLFKKNSHSKKNSIGFSV